MDIVFGLWADGGAWPPHGGGDDGGLGAPVVGPAGLTDLLESAYGLGGPTASQVERTAAWQRALETADDGRRFYSASLAADAWSTARLLLGWRDQLVDAGWDPSIRYRSPRLADLASAAGADADLPRGPADRVAALCAAVRDDDRAAAPARLRLIDRRHDLPTAIRRLVDALERAGVEIEQLGPVPAAAEDAALGRLQRYLLHGTEPHGRNPHGGDLHDSDLHRRDPHPSDQGVGTAPDGTVVAARGSSAVLAGEIVADHLAAIPPARRTLVIAPPQEGSALDEALARRGAPRTGAVRSSPHRGSLQVLLLAFQVAWRPLDVQALLDLLLVENGPLPRRAAWRLARALENAPGIGNAHWRGAWERIESDLRERDLHDGDLREDDLREADDRAVASRIERWKAWTEPAGADPQTGMAEAEALAICDRVAAWATARFQASGDALFLATARLAADVRAALVRLQRTHLPKPLVDRVIDQALDAGEHDPAAYAEASPWHVVAHPGAIWGPTDTVVWWDVRDQGEHARRAPWTDAERRELAAAGADLDDDARAARALSAAWERAVHHAGRRLLLVSVGLDADGDDTAHPLTHRIAPVAGAVLRTVRLEDAIYARELDLVGAPVVRASVTLTAPPAPVTTWPVPSGFFARLETRRQSATSLEDLLECQLKWALRDVARIRPGSAGALPDASRLLGSLAHELAATLFPPGPPPDPDRVRADAAALLEEVIPRSAAPLLQPEHAVDLVQARRRLPAALEALARTLARNRLSVVDTERWVEAQPEGAPPLHGAIDLLTTDDAGAPAILDLKWTRSRSYRVAELKEGRAIQLATYGAMTANGGPPRGGYFLLKQREFVTLDGTGLTGTSVRGDRDLGATWDAVVASWHAWLDAARGGELLATGVDPDIERPRGAQVVREVKCEWCDFATVCRVNGAA